MATSFLHKKYTSFLFLFILMSSAFSQVKINEVIFNNSDLSSYSTKTLVTQDAVDPQHSTCLSSVNRSILLVKLDFGEIYRFADHNVNAKVEFTVNAYDDFTGGNVVFTKNAELEINNLIPDNLWEFEFSKDQNSIKRIEIVPTNYTNSAPVGMETQLNNAVTFLASFQNTKTYNVTNQIVTNNVPTIANPTSFSWNNNGCEVYGYEFQIVRLYNINPTLSHDPLHCNGALDWNQALVIHVEGNVTSLDLTLSEGTGYYAWRVRPIGNQFGGFGDSRDWGIWSTNSINFASGSTNLNAFGTQASNPEFVFFYNQFDEDINFIHSQTFSEGNRLHESIQYANGLGNVRQSQVKLKNENHILMSQSLEDYSGRSTIAAMGAPVTQDAFGYKQNLLQNNGVLYGPQHFDEDANFKDPLPINGGEVADYYSDNNPDLTIPSAEGFPYTRSLFYQDGLNLVKEQSGLGATHKIYTPNTANGEVSRTTRTLYSVPSDQELIKVFGDEAPYSSTVKKVTTLDPNKVASVTYVGLNGKTIATCLTSSDGALSTMDDIAHGPATSITKTMQTSSKSGLNELTGSLEMSFAKPTDVTFNYSLTSKEIENICASYCSTCDYWVELVLKDLETNTSEVLLTKQIESVNCGSSADYNMTPIVKTLPFGNYVLYKTIKTNNLNTSVFSDSADFINAVSYSNYHVHQSNSIISNNIETALTDVYAALDTSNWEEFRGDTIDVGCGEIVVPDLSCTNLEDSCEFFDFEAYFNDYWNAKDTSNRNLNVLNAFSLNFLGVVVNNGDINTMMDVLQQNGHNCLELRQCWMGFTANYLNYVDHAAVDPDFTFDRLKTLLECITPAYSGIYISTPTNIHYAGVFFPYNLGDEPTCELAIFGGPITQSILDNYQDDPNASLFDSLGRENRKWYQFVKCINSEQVDMDIPSDPIAAADKISGECKNQCNDRYGSFKQALVREYHNNNQYIDGDQYVLVLNENIHNGEVYSFDRNQPLDTSIVTFIDSNDIFCASQNLVEHCMSYCELSAQYDSANSVFSSGTALEHENITKAMLWNFDIQLNPGNQACSNGYETIGTHQGTLNDGLNTLDTSIVKFWEKSFGGVNSQETTTGILNVDDGYIIYGHVMYGNPYSGEASIGGIDYWVIKVDNNGSYKNSALIGSAKNDVLTSAEINSDGEIFLFGNSDGTVSFDKTTNPAGMIDKWIVKLDKNLNVIKEVSFPDNNRNSTGYSPYDMFPLRSQKLKHNEDLITVGGVDGVNKNGIHYLKIDHELNVLSEFTYIDNDYDLATMDFELNETLNVLYVTTKAIHDNNNTSSTRLYAFDLNNNFNVLDVYNIGTGNTNATSVDQDSSINSVLELDSLGNVYIASLNNNTGGDYDSPFGTFGLYDLYVHKISFNETTNSFSEIWANKYGGELSDGVSWLFFQTIAFQITDDNKILLSTSSESSKSVSALDGNKTEDSYGDQDLWFLELDENGNILRQKTYGGLGEDIASSINYIQRPEGGHYLLMGGYSDSPISGSKTSSLIGGKDLWAIAFREYCTFTPICFKWVEPGELPEELVIEIKELSCDELVSQMMQDDIDLQVANILKNEKINLIKNYKTNCVSPDSLQDVCSVTYLENLFHYTLYYYDRAGNLVRTVPPEGVDESSTSRTQHPNHEFVTSYNYNSLGQLVSQNTPDGGYTKFLYDELSSLRYSQNAQQKIDGTFSYVKYDNLNRPVQAGISNQNVVPLVGTQVISNYVNDQSFPTTGLDQTVNTVYSDNAIVNGIVEHPVYGAQQHLENRVSYSYTDEGSYTFYSYDIHGNVKWMSEQIPYLGRNYVSYEYDLLTSAVQRVDYNEGRSDEFHHYYAYDDQGRVTDVLTGRYKPALFNNTLPFNQRINNEIEQVSIQNSRYSTLTHDANYQYYKHGPLKRKELGSDKIQGVDNAYTIHGWLKGINHTNLNPANSQGNDGGVGSEFSKDVWGSVLSYYDGDFNRTNSEFNNTNAGLISSQGITNPLYNGNIAAWTSNIGNSQYATDLAGNQYRYDLLNRIKNADFSSNTNSTWTSTNQYDANFAYDGNGNLLSLNRNGNLTNAVGMDNLSYSYHTIGGKKSNRLKRVVDSQANAGLYASDFDNHSADYQYDAIGNLKEDLDENISKITWLANGKVDYVEKSNGDVIDFMYNSLGNRISKKVTASGVDKVTYYVRDATGNVMSNYERKTDNNQWVYHQTEIPLLGSSREGVYETYDELFTQQIGGGSQDLNCITCTDIHFANYTMNQLFGRAGYETKWTRELLHRKYQLADHLGNVRGIVMDRKIPNNEANLISVNNYYPFGMMMPGRSLSSEEYRYGFNGKENINELDNDIYDLGARIYDSRIGKMFSIDPWASKYSWQTTYAYHTNSPIWRIDWNGLGGGPGFWEAFIVKSFKNMIELGAYINNNPSHAGYGFNTKAITKEQIEQYSIDYSKVFDPYYQIEQFSRSTINTVVGIYRFGEAIIELDGAKAADNLKHVVSGASSVYGVRLKLPVLKKGYIPPIYSIYIGNAKKRLIEYGKTIIQKGRPYVISAVTDNATGKVYFGQNKTISSIEEVHPELRKRLPEKSLEEWTTYNCAECDAFNKALNDGAKWKDLLDMHTMKYSNIKKSYVDFEQCDNCKVTYKDKSSTSDKTK